MWKKLLLFDIDGTLIKIGGSRHGHAFELALAEHTGKRISIIQADPFGKTDTGILMSMLTMAGYNPEEAGSMIPRIFETMTAYYLENEIDLHPYVFQGALRTIRELSGCRDFLLGLLTGNHEIIGWHKLRKAGLESYFSVGSFGNEALERSDLVDIVLRKIEKQYGFGFRKKDTLIIGDTPRDVECGKKNGTMTVAVATGSFSKEQLRQCGADLVLEDLGKFEAIFGLLTGHNE
jgi:phosphoglycolate phosphatase